MTSIGLSRTAGKALGFALGVLLGVAPSAVGQDHPPVTQARPPVATAATMPKAIVQVVPGRSGYLVTADGARYFVGALLPTGQTIIEIKLDAVIVSKDGQVSRLAL